MPAVPGASSPTSHIQHQLQLIGLELPAPLAVIQLTGTEQLGGLYRYEILCEAAAGFDASQCLDLRACLTLGAGTQRRVWGQISAARCEHARGVPRWILTLEPRLAALSRVRLNQVFLNQSSVQTVQAVLGQHGADGADGLSAQWQDWQLASSYPAFAQRSCHEQDALSFILWLLEFEGITLRFEHTDAGERMVFFDSLAGYDRTSASMAEGAGLRIAARSGLVTDSEPETLTRAHTTRRPQVDTVRLTEYDHLQAQVNLQIELDAPQPGTGLTHHAHGEHYKSRAHGEQLARVRLQERQCRQDHLHGEGPLIELQAGRVIQVEAAFWLITALQLQTHRDGRLNVVFEASPAEQMWRPERVTPRPRVHGLLAAKVSQGSPIARLDELGRYLVQYPWQDGQEQATSKPVRLAQPYAGPTYGTHAPLKDNTEVWLTHAHGDPDRPLILGSTHSGQEPDAVTARDNSRNVIRTRAGNKLRLEDRQGQEHIKLHTPHGTSQLILGHAVDHAKQPRGQGLELRTELHGVVRTGHQLLITTGSASPRFQAEAQRSASSADIRATLANLDAFIGNRSLAAEQVGAHPHHSVATAGQASQQLQGAAQAPTGPSPPNQVHWAQAGQIAGAPTIQLAASRNLGAWSIGAQDWLSGGKLQIAAKDASRVHVEQGGRKAFVSEGNFQTTVSKGRLHLVVEGKLTLHSQGKDLSLKAQGSSLKLTAGGHAGLKSAGKTVVQTGIHKALAGAVMLQGGSAAQTVSELTATPMKTDNWLELHHHYDDLEPVKGAPYTVTFKNGRVFEGKLDDQGGARLQDIPSGVAQVRFGEDLRTWQSGDLDNAHAGIAKTPETAQALIQQLLGSGT